MLEISLELFFYFNKRLQNKINKRKKYIKNLNYYHFIIENYNNFWTKNNKHINRQKAILSFRLYAKSSKKNSNNKKII